MCGKTGSEKGRGGARLILAAKSLTEAIRWKEKLNIQGADICVGGQASGKLNFGDSVGAE
jgi:hypothetical protein